MLSTLSPLPTIFRCADSTVAYICGDNFAKNVAKNAAKNTDTGLDSNWVMIDSEAPARVEIPNLGVMVAAAAVGNFSPPTFPAEWLAEFTAEELADADGNISGYFADGKWCRRETPLEYCRRMKYNDELRSSRG